jgi:phage shock protein PspC (stress-responsive transcriptional regulator)
VAAGGSVSRLARAERPVLARMVRNLVVFVVGRGGPLAAAWVRDNVLMSYMNGNGKVLVRKREGRIIAGVCAGLADYIGIDVNLLRVIVALISLFTVGTGVLAYLIAWAVIPEEGSKSSVAEDFVNKNRQG